METEEKKYPIEDLDKLEGDIIVVVGKLHHALAHTGLAGMGFDSAESLSRENPGARGLLDKPESICLDCEGKPVSTEPYDLVCNVESVVNSGFKGIILTNSHFVVDAVDLYSRKAGRKARFFYADGDCLVEHTGYLEPVYAQFAKAVDTLEDLRSELESWQGSV